MIFTGLNQYIEIPRGTEKYSRLRKERQCRVRSGLFFIYPSNVCPYAPLTLQAEEDSERISVHKIGLVFS